MGRTLEQLDAPALAQLETDLQLQLEQFRSRQLALDLTRGKPSTEQLALSDSLDGILDSDYRAGNGSDLRNYGGLDGLAEAKQLFADMLGVDTEAMIIGGNSSLTLMYFTVLFALELGATGPETAWRKEPSTVKFLAPVPGYDRHFAICEQLGIEMIALPMDDQGPDMDLAEALVKDDPMIKGIWCVPRFSNPTGVVYSDEVVQRLARLPAMAGANFRVFCDNAYAVHSLDDNAPKLTDVMAAFETAGTTDALYLFGSTSKITFAGAGVGFVAMSAANKASFQRQLGITQIGPDKVNQERHVKLLRDQQGVSRHMRAHAAILKPRFDCVLKRLDEGLTEWELASWSEPQGGYFVSVDVLPGLAKAVVEMAASVGVVLTPAGATHPYGVDAADSTIRIAPSFPSLEEIDQAMQVFVLCVKLASVQQLRASTT